MVQVAIMGFGTIGSGVAEVLCENRKEIAKSAGREVTLKYILDRRDFVDTPWEKLVVHDFEVIRQDPEVTVVVETIGGLEFSYPYVKACLQAGKSVVTSNKALVAAYGTELLQIAREKQVNFLFEASVGGGIPIVRSLYRALCGEKIYEITGILNGTTNFILSKMEREGASFEAVLKEAQSLGYAERNPEADVEGYDACRKLAILTALVTGKEVHYEDIPTEGITSVGTVDFAYAKAMNATIKLFASSRICADKVSSWVAPMMVGPEHPLAGVCGVYNSIIIKSNMLGTSMYYGNGAGKLPTASAVVADVIEAVQNEGNHIPMGWSGERLEIAEMKETAFSYFVRIGGNAEKLLPTVRQVFGDVRVVELADFDEFAVLTPKMTEAELKDKVGRMDGVRQIIRTEGLIG